MAHEIDKSNEAGHIKSSMKKGDIAEKYKAAEQHYLKVNNKPVKVAQHQHLGSAEGSTTFNQEPVLRASTTDSSRVPKSRHDDSPIGGNVR
ncbi:hypothetical protein [Pontibacter vulgaris]|uniref:hypothetical protein n=1 Tax=Pontibacter vulgaris TaxID=2905679 RepID=UPI001FA7637C|nr:hypothetical protein [Pontibacter vulgaris]